MTNSIEPVEVTKKVTLEQIDYVYKEGYADIKPGITFSQDSMAMLGDKVVMKPESFRSPFNEIQIRGSKKARSGECCEDKVLYLDHPDYDKLIVIKSHWATRNFPVDTPLQEVRRIQQLISSRDVHLTGQGVHPVGEGWGAKLTLDEKKFMVHALQGIPDEVLQSLQSEEDEIEFCDTLFNWLEAKGGYVSFIL